ncbi:MAG TPA: ABC transporter permease [Gemmatimonadaceae bacterium]|nr:ABC transporter permease [Gemmatimonadaceae bacterium]
MPLPDLRFALRSLARSRGFATTVILTLGLGIGANTAIFSVVRAVLLKPLPHREGDRLVYLRQSIEGPGGENIRFSVPEILDFRNSAKSLQGIAEYSGVLLTLQGKDDAVRMQVGLVTGNYFQVMGLSPVLGRVLDERDDGTGVPPVVVLTHDYWHQRFGGDATIVGKSVRIDGRAVEVVGVLQPAPTFPERFDALMNMVISEHHTSAMMVHGRTHRMTDMIARLAPGATLDQARSEVATIRKRVQAEFPEAYDAGSGYRVTVTPFVEVLGERARLTLWLLMGAAAFVMVISAANVANLSLMRGVRREHELVIRSALGAGTARLRRLLLVENLLLASAGAVLGLLIAIGGVRLLAAFAERYSPRANEIRIDGVVLAFTLLLTVAIAILISYAPRLAAEGRLGTLIAAGASRASGSLARQRLQRTLVVAQVAVSVVLLTGAGLLTRTMQRLSSVDSGLTAEEVLTMEVPISGGGRSDADTKALYARMREAVRALPGVRAVGVGSTMPLRATPFQLDVKGEGHTLAAGEPQPRAELRTADPDYFKASAIPLLQGREFTSTDRDSSQRVVIINQTLARQLFPGRDPIGLRVAWTGEVLKFIGISGEWRTIVGVVGDTRDGGLDAAPRGVVFTPFTQEFAYAGGLVIRASGNAQALAGAATRVVRDVVPHDPIEHVLTVSQIKEESVAPRRLNAILVSAFGMLAVIIAAVGIAGVLAFSVSARTNEIGIRMSLGADAARVQRMILREGGMLLAAGGVLGGGGGVIGTRLIRGLLFGVAPHDPLTLAAVGTAMIAVGVAACWVPAARAARIEPVVAMRGG